MPAGIALYSAIVVANYSWRSASMGLRPAARLAGYSPKKTPMASDTTTASRMLWPVTSASLALRGGAMTWGAADQQRA